MSTVDREPAPDDVGRAAKHANPEPVADHGNGMPPDLLIIFRRQQSPAHGRHAEQGKEFPRYEVNRGQLCLTFTIDEPVHPRDPAHRRQSARDWRCASKLIEDSIRKLIRGPGRSCGPRNEQLLGIPDRQGPKHQCVQYREDRGVDADAQR